MLQTIFRVGDEVASAVADGVPVVAMESTIYSAFGLPEPANLECLERCVAVIRAAGAVPAMTAVLDGVAVVGIADDEVERARRHHEDRRPRSRSRPRHRTQRRCYHRVGVGDARRPGRCGRVRHRRYRWCSSGGSETGDVSHDLLAIARHPVVTVSAGAKAFLDLPRTLEEFETLGVPVVGWNTDRFPAFYTATPARPSR